MKKFRIDGQLWGFSECGQFVQLIEGSNRSGWFRLDNFNERFKAAAATAE